MSLENYTGVISDLVVTNPIGTDPKSQGDEHLRGVKLTMVNDGLFKSRDRGVANGVASLDATAKVPIAQLPDAVLTETEATATYIPLAQKGAGSGVAPLDASGKMPLAYEFASAAHCQFKVLSATLCTLVPFGGNVVTIEGVARNLLDVGVNIDQVALPANSVVYYVYAYWTGSAIALEVSTTAYTQAYYGMAFKTGDATRTLVGMVMKTGDVFADNFLGRHVRSFYNDPGIGMKFQSSNAPVINAAPFVEIDATWRVSGLFWAAEAVKGSSIVAASNAGASTPMYLQLGIDATGPASAVYGITSVTQSGYAQAVSPIQAELSEGFHDFRMLGGSGASLTTVASYCGMELSTLRKAGF